jgi:uncharacterized PurR-regulated membrane protein YhhQ (DUF165 family)
MISKTSLAATFLLTIPASNYLITNVGSVCQEDGPCLIPVGFGLMAPSGVLLVGLALVLRDLLQERFGPYFTLSLVVLGSILSYFLASPYIAVASAVAYLLAEMLDQAVYTTLRKKFLLAGILLSGFVGAVVDSVVFLMLAFGSLDFVVGQIVGKLYATLLGATVILYLREK